MPLDISQVIPAGKIQSSRSLNKFKSDSFFGINKYKVYPVYYPVGNGIFNIDKSIEDIKWIIENEINKEKSNGKVECNISV